MQTVIRRAQSSACAALTDLIFKSKQSNGYDDNFMLACREELTVIPAQLTQEFWVAEEGGLKGCASLRIYNQTSAEVEKFFVCRECQRQGIGQLLWQKILSRASELGIFHLHLNADPAAVPFYQSLGFSVVGETPSDSIPGRRLPHMTLEIPKICK